MSSGTITGPISAGGPPSGDGSSGNAAFGWSLPFTVDDAKSRMAANILSIQLAVVMFTQKLAVPLGGSGSGRNQIALALVIQYVVLAIFAWRGMLRVEPLRLMLFCLFCGVAFFFQTRVSATSFSVTAIFLLLTILAIYVFVIPIKHEDYLLVVKNFILLACIAGCLTWFDWTTQLLHIGKTNLHLFIPDTFLYKEYNYMNKMWGGLLRIKPNGTFFLEMSHLSQFIAMGFVFECVFFQRLRYAIFLAISLIGSFGGTGLLLVLFCSPFLLPRLPLSMVLAGVVAVPIVLSVAFVTGYIETAASRTAEFDDKSGSAHIRFVMPAMAVADAMAGPLDDLLLGQGAGSMKKGSSHIANSFAWAPYSKVIVEYGLILAVIWFLLIFVSMFRPGIPAAASMALFVQYHLLNGALSVPLHSVYAFILVTGCYFTNGPPPSANGGRDVRPHPPARTGG